ncbi:MAG: signal recognition particle subunit SRP19/SEC65 family protein [Promethearchaeota archaeon]
MRSRGKRIIWPQYFDSERTRKFGRKIPMEKAIPLPAVNELAEAATALDYEVEVYPYAKYPKTWWDPPGYLLIHLKGQKKKNVMEKMAPKILQIREKERALQNDKKKKGKKKRNYKKA